MSPHDQTFMKHFLQLIGGLVTLALVLALGAGHIHAQQPKEAATDRAAAVAARIAPVGDVYVGSAGQAALAATSTPVVAEAAAQAPDGGKIFNGLCVACHGAGVAGAPKLEKAAWEARVAQGIDTLVSHASNGFTGKSGTMPPRGGNPALTDAEVRAAVQWMVDNLK